MQTVCGGYLETLYECFQLSNRYGNEMISRNSRNRQRICYLLVVVSLWCNSLKCSSFPVATLQSLHNRDRSKFEDASKLFASAFRGENREVSHGLSAAFDDCHRRQLISFMLSSGTPFLFSVDRSDAASLDSAKSESHEESLSIIKPPLDDCTYEAYTLENGLRVLLCSDPSPSYEAAAAMDVHVGACSDPTNIPGLAHFVEHMIFLGTKKYPKEDSFGEFLSLNGGSSNAYTDSENTVYFFSMNAESDKKLMEGLSRFGAFFSCPLFTETATGRELNAIESENAKNLQSDIFREFQIFKSRANSDHPFSKFFTGNKKTLLKQTEELGLDLRLELIKFYNKYYSANQMTLAVVAPYPIALLKEMISQCFLEIPNKFIPKPEVDWNGIAPFSQENSKIPSFRNKVEVVPVSDLRQVYISWPIVYTAEFDRFVSQITKSSQYIAHLLGHEGPRSLLSFLKKRGWVNSLGASTNEVLSDFETFEVVIGLTSKGFLAVDDVIEATYSYINLISQQIIPDYVFNEVLQLSELQWRFFTKGGSAEYATSLSTTMQYYPPKLYVAGPRRLALDEFATERHLLNKPRTSYASDEQLRRTRDQVKLYSTFLNVDSAIVTIVSKSFDGQTNRKEQWYDTAYSVREIPQGTLERWRKCQSARNLKMDFPTRNIFIPTETSLQVKYPPDQSIKFRKSFEERMIPPEAPRIIRDDGIDGRWTVYFKEDKQFGKPKGILIFQLLSNRLFSSPSNAALANLYEICVIDKLREYTYDAELAGLSYDVKIAARGIRLSFGGYNDKMKKFALFVCDQLSVHIHDILPTDDKDFERYKDQVMRALSAFDVSQPYFHASYYAQLTLQPRRFQYSNKSIRDETRKITLPDLVSFAESIWTAGRGECLIQGNFIEAEALDLANSIAEILPFNSIPVKDYPPRLQALPLPTSGYMTLPPRLLIAEPNPSNENSVTYVMLQSLGKTDEDHVLMELLHAVIEEPFYNDLRTKKQLGYIVASGVKGMAETRTISFIVQSNIAPSNDLSLQVLKFLDEVENNLLTSLSNTDLDGYIKSLVERKTDPAKDLATEATRNWSEISTGSLKFDRLQQEASALLSIKKQNLLKFWQQIYVSDTRRILITEIIPQHGVASSPIPLTSAGYGRSDFPKSSFILGIDDIDQFRRDRERPITLNMM